MLFLLNLVGFATQKTRKFNNLFFNKKTELIELKNPFFLAFANFFGWMFVFFTIATTVSLVLYEGGADIRFWLMLMDKFYYVVFVGFLAIITRSQGLFFAFSVQFVVNFLAMVLHFDKILMFSSIALEPLRIAVSLTILYLEGIIITTLFFIFKGRK